MSFVSLRQVCTWLAFASSFAIGSPRHRGTTIDSNAVVGFPETVPNNITGTLYLKYKPHLYIHNGCVPFPAVDAEGNVSGGLKPTHASNKYCSSSTGQVYSRAGTHNGYYAIMYSWFMPKDEPSNGLGHRYDWENIVVWLKNPDTAAPALLGVAASAHGKYHLDTSPALTGTSPLIQYRSTWPTNHRLDFTSTVGSQQPLIAWESLTAAAKQTLNTFDFHHANVPFTDDEDFQRHLAAAAL